MRPANNALPLLALAALVTVAGPGCKKRQVVVEPNRIPTPETTTPTPPPAGTTPMPGDPPPPTSPTTPVPPVTPPPPTPSAPSAAQPRVRVIHAAAGAPAVDIFVNGDPVIANLAYKAATPYAAAPVSAVSATVRAAGSQTSLLGPTALTFLPGRDYTVIAAGGGTGGALTPLLLADDRTPPAAGGAKVRVVHAAPDAPAVDIYLNDRAAIANLTFGQATAAYTQLPAATYQVKVVPTGSSRAVLGPLPLSLQAGKVYTVIAAGRAGDGSLNVQVYPDN